MNRELMLPLIATIVCFGLVVLIFCVRRKRSTRCTSCPTAEDSGVDETLPAADEQLMQEPAPIEECGSEPKKADDKPNDEEERGVTQNAQLIADLHRLFEEEKVFLQHDIHIEDVAKLLYTNRTYVTRLMRQEYGLTFIEYVNIARIQYSQSLLYTTNMTLDEVAEHSGFQSTSNYCRTFKRYIGTTPLAWKNSLPK